MKRWMFPALLTTLFGVSSATAQNTDSTQANTDSTQAQTLVDKETTAMPSGASVAEMVFCTSVHERQFVGEASSFGADVGSVTCFTKITAVDGESSVTHVWYHGDQEMGRVELPVRSSMWRTWSAKTMPPGATGKWRVDVLSAAGDVLKSASFTVGESGGQ